MDSPEPMPPDSDLVTDAPPSAPVDRPLPRRGARWVVALSVLAVTGLLGFPLGWAWSSAAPWLPAQVESDGLYYVSAEPEQPAGAEGWFILLSFGTGAVFAVLTWVLLRRYRGPLTLGGLTIGSIITGWLAWRFGHNIGRGAMRAQVAAAKPGTIVKVPPTLRIRTVGPTAKHDWGIDLWHGIPYIGGVLLFVAVAAIFVYVILAAFSMSPSLGLRRHAEAAAAAQAAAAEQAAIEQAFVDPAAADRAAVYLAAIDPAAADGATADPVDGAAVDPAADSDTTQRPRD